MEHFKIVNVSPTPSTTTTLVGSPPASSCPSRAADSKVIRQSSGGAPRPVPSLEHTPLTTAFQAEADDLPALRRVSTEQFSVIRVLGQGSFGTVYLVEDKITRKLFALKSILKHSIETVRYPIIFMEQDILKRLAGDPAFLTLHASFEDELHFHFLTVRIHSLFVVHVVWLTSCAGLLSGR